MEIMAISDLHLCTEPVLQRTDLDLLQRFLIRVRDRVASSDLWLLLVGDGIERLYQSDVAATAQMPVVRLLAEIGSRGRLVALNGNHDEKMFGLPFRYHRKIEDEADQWVWSVENLRALHGHQFDPWCRGGPWDNLGCLFVRALATITRRRPDVGKLSKIVEDEKAQSRFRERCIREARARACLLVVGHSHRAEYTEGQADAGRWGVCNTGCWQGERADVTLLRPDTQGWWSVQQWHAAEYLRQR